MSARFLRLPPTVVFILTFGVSFALLTWILGGAGPLPAVNRFIQQVTQAQADAAAGLLRMIGEDLTVTGSVLGGETFACDVREGCNGMSALTLLLAGLLSFPATIRQRLAGLVILTPVVAIVNIIRIAGLYWTGAHLRDRFVDMHVYVGQVVVILVTAGAWLGWLSWTSRKRAARS